MKDAEHKYNFGKVLTHEPSGKEVEILHQGYGLTYLVKETGDRSNPRFFVKEKDLK